MQQRLDNFLVPHTKSAVVNPNIYKYHDFARTRQQLQAEEGGNAKGSDSKLMSQGALPNDLHASTADHLSSGNNGLAAQSPFFLD